jgi:hypothetical protein
MPHCLGRCVCMVIPWESFHDQCTNHPVFKKKKSFIHLLDDQIQCVCSTTTQLRRFCDPLIVNEYSDFCKPGTHVCTMDLDVIQHLGLRQALKQGLNHVLFRPTNIAQAVATALEAFDQLVL